MSLAVPVVAAHIRVDGRYRCVSKGWARTYSPPGDYRPPRAWADIDHRDYFGLAGPWLESYRAAQAGEPTIAVESVVLPGKTAPDSLAWCLLPMGDHSVLCIAIDAAALADMMLATAVGGADAD